MSNPKVMSRFLSAPVAASLHHCLKNKQLKLICFSDKDPTQLGKVWIILAYD